MIDFSKKKLLTEINPKLSKLTINQIPVTNLNFADDQNYSTCNTVLTGRQVGQSIENDHVHFDSRCNPAKQDLSADSDIHNGRSRLSEKNILVKIVSFQEFTKKRSQECAMLNVGIAYKIRSLYIWTRDVFGLSKFKNETNSDNLLISQCTF